MDALRPRIVLGQLFAEALQAEERRSEMSQTRSPLPQVGYDELKGELNLLDPFELEADRKLTEFVRQYGKLNDGDRLSVRNSLSLDDFYTLLTFARRAAVMGVRDGHCERVKDGGLAIAIIDYERIDPRDIIWSLAIIYHCGKQMRCQIDRMFQDMAELADSKVAEVLRDYLHKDEEFKDIQASWGYTQVVVDGRVGLVRSGFDSYEPSCDLLGAALDIGDMASFDQYCAWDVELATNLPEVWLKPSPPYLLEKALQKITAGVTVTARLRPELHPDSAHQRLWAFLVELDDNHAAEKLYDLIVATGLRGNATLGVRAGRLVCLVVGRSTMHEAPSFETAESLGRFAQPLSLILERYSSAAA